MTHIRSFKAFRPKKDSVRSVACPPYDVINSEEARKLAEGNPESFLHVVRSEIDLPPGTDAYDDSIYSTAAENLKKLIDDKILIQDDKPSMYLYTQQMGSHIQTGLVALCSVEDYDNDIIKKHEKTRKEKEDDRARHVKTLQANTGPVFMLYPDRRELNDILEHHMANQPDISFTSEDGIKHSVRVINFEGTIDRIVSEFDEIPAIYIADGHHRAASAARAGRDETDESKKHFLAVLFPGSQLNILAYNRVVKSLNNNSPEDFLKKVEEKFVVAKTGDAPSLDTRQFGMYLAGNWYHLAAKEGTFVEDDPVASLDVSILQDNLLHPILGIDDPRTSKEIDFVGGIRGNGELMRLVDGKGFEVAFSLHPVTVSQLMAIADSGSVMPPKSTWFEPKLRSGLFVNKF